MSDTDNAAEDGIVLDPFTAPPVYKTVVLAAPYTDSDGNEHKADAEVELERAEANHLLHIGAARTVDQDAEQQAEIAAGAAASVDAPSDRIEDILHTVGDNVDRARAALEAEKSGKARITLVSKLEAIIDPTKGN